MQSARRCACGRSPLLGSRRLRRSAASSASRPPGPIRRGPARGAAPALSGLRRRRRRPPFAAAGHAARSRCRPLRRVLRPSDGAGDRRRRRQRRGRRHVSGADARRRPSRRRLLQRDRVRPRAARALALAHGRVGRSCIHPAWRTGGTILALWSALGEFMVLHGLDVAFGCASVAMSDGGHAAASLWRSCPGAPRSGRAPGPAAAAARARDAARRPRRRDAVADPRLPALRRRTARTAGVRSGFRDRRPADADDARRPAAGAIAPLPRPGRRLTEGRRQRFQNGSARAARRSAWRQPCGARRRAAPSASRR